MGFILFIVFVCVLYKVSYGVFTSSMKKEAEKKQREQTIMAHRIREKEARDRYEEAKARFEKTGNEYDRRIMNLEEKIWLDLCKIHSKEYRVWHDI